MAERPTPPHHFRVNPQCPICRHDLLPVATEFVGSIAFCFSCAQSAETTWITAVVASRSDPNFGGSWSTHRGLLYFTPRSHYPRNESVPMLAQTLAARRLNIVESESEV